MSKPWSDMNSDPLADLREVADKIKADSLLPHPPNPVVTWAERPIVSDPNWCSEPMADGTEMSHVFRPDNPTGLPVCVHCYGRKF